MEHLKDIIPSRDPDLVLGLFDHLFGSATKMDLRRRFPEFSQAKQFWENVPNSGYVMKNCKLFAFAKARDSKARPKDFGVHPSDAAILGRVDLRFIAKRFRPYSLTEFTELETRILTSSALSNFVGKFINRKLIFISRYYGVPSGEIRNHLLCAGLYALRKKYPCFETELHALNTCKTSIHNAGMGLIEHWTRKKRNTIQDGKAVVVDYDSLRDVGVAPEHDSDFRVNLTTLVQASAQLHPAHQRFLSAAAGIHDAALSTFLGTPNSDLAESLPYDRYLSQLRLYFGIDEATQASVLAAMRSHLV